MVWYNGNLSLGNSSSMDELQQSCNHTRRTGTRTQNSNLNSYTKTVAWNNDTWLKMVTTHPDEQDEKKELEKSIQWWVTSPKKHGKSQSASLQERETSWVKVFVECCPHLNDNIQLIPSWAWMFIQSCLLSGAAFSFEEIWSFNGPWRKNTHQEMHNVQWRSLPGDSVFNGATSIPCRWKPASSKEMTSQTNI